MAFEIRSGVTSNNDSSIFCTIGLSVLRGWLCLPSRRMGTILRQLSFALTACQCQPQFKSHALCAGLSLPVLLAASRKGKTWCNTSQTELWCKYSLLVRHISRGSETFDKGFVPGRSGRDMTGPCGTRVGMERPQTIGNVLG